MQPPFGDQTTYIHYPYQLPFGKLNLWLLWLVFRSARKGNAAQNWSISVASRYQRRTAYRLRPGVVRDLAHSLSKASFLSFWAITQSFLNNSSRAIHPFPFKSTEQRFSACKWAESVSRRVSTNLSVCRNFFDIFKYPAATANEYFSVTRISPRGLSWSYLWFKCFWKSNRAERDTSMDHARSLLTISPCRWCGKCRDTSALPIASR